MSGLQSDAIIKYSSLLHATVETLIMEKKFRLYNPNCLDTHKDKCQVATKNYFVFAYLCFTCFFWIKLENSY